MNRRRGALLAGGVSVAVLGGVIARLVLAPPPPWRAWEPPVLDTASMQPRVAALLEGALGEVRGHPDSARAWGVLGMSCEAHGLMTCAVTCYAHARTLGPDDFVWPYLEATAREGQGASVDEVVGLYAQARALDPGYPALLVRLGDALRLGGRLEAACAAYEEALRADPDVASARRGLGQALVALGRFDEARRELEAVRLAAPRDGPTLLALARVYGALGDGARAARTARDAGGLTDTLLLYDPVRADIEALGVSSALCFKRGEGFMQARDYPRAVEQFRIVTESSPDSARVQARLAAAYAASNRPAEAVRHYARALELDPRAHDAHRALGALLFVSDPAAALEHYRRAVELAPGNAGYVADEATALASLGRLDEAVIRFQEAADLGLADPVVEANWGTALLQRGALEAAADHFRAALRLRPDDADARRKLEYVLERLPPPDEGPVHGQGATAAAP